MTHGTAATDTGRARGGRPGTVSLALRPFGYLLVGLVWLAIWLVVVALGPGILVWIAVDGTMTFGEVAGNQPAESWVVAGLLVVPIVVAVWGPGVFWYLPCATWPPAALSFLYVIRSLLPRYAAERLSHSERAPRGTSLGPPTVGGVTLSLQPVRPTRLTDLLMKFYLSGWDIDGRAFLAMLPAGLAFVLAFPALATDMPVGVRVGCGVSTVALAIWSTLRVRSRFRDRFRAGLVRSWADGD